MIEPAPGVRCRLRHSALLHDRSSDLSWWPPIGLEVRVFRVSFSGPGDRRPDRYLVESIDGRWEGAVTLRDLKAVSPLEQLADVADD